MLLTARSAPAGFPVTIRDLGSRLRALPSVALAPPDDVLLRSLIVKLAADRQLAVDEALVNYLANRIERSFAAAHAAVVRLDEEAMRQHRPVTRALAAELFRALTAFDLPESLTLARLDGSPIGRELSSSRHFCRLGI